MSPTLGPSLQVTKAWWEGALLTEACRAYRRAGLFAYYFARGKFGRDPVYRAILEHGLLSGCARILDLGCGQALLTAWLQAAERLYARGDWPPSWPDAPSSASTRGIELMVRDVERARRALGAGVDVVAGDIRCTEFGNVDAVVVLDVLHYMVADAQYETLRRIREALQPGGLLLLRVGDAKAGLRYRYTQWVDMIVMLSRGHSFTAPHCRSVAEWESLLRQCGFDSEAHPMSRGTPFANVLLIAHAR